MAPLEQRTDHPECAVHIHIWQIHVICTGQLQGYADLLAEAYDVACTLTTACIAKGSC